MKKTAFRYLCATLSLLLALDTAAAGRWLRSHGGGHGCHAAPTSCDGGCGVVVSPCEPVGDPCGGCGGGCGETVVTAPAPADCGCGGGVTSESPVVDVYAPVQAGEPTPALEPEYNEPTPVETFGDGFRSDTPAPADAADPPGDDWNAGFDEPMDDEPMTEGPVDEPMEEEELPPAPTTPELFEDPAPLADEPADLFDDEPMAEEPANDLFGDEPTDEAPADDLFGDEPAVEEPAADEPMSDDLFGDPAPADEPMPTDEAPADDLFGAPMDEPADEPMAEEPADDLFSDPMPEPSEAPADDLFGDEPAAEEPAADDPMSDDLFGEDPFPAEEPAAEPAPAEAPAPADEAPAEEEPAGDDAFDDLFGDFGAILREPGGVDSVAARTWVDDTGRFSTVGRLLAVDGSVIRLTKVDGGVATVPLARLSQADLEFVSRQVLAQHQAHEWAIAHGVRPDAERPKQAQADEAHPLRTAQL